MIHITITEDALCDLHEAYWFYEQQSAGLGDYFSSSLDSEIESLKITAGIHRMEYRDYYRLVCKVFPYAVYYTLTEEKATVWAIVDCRRDPDWIKSHLDS